jgi:hypothetical protein
MTTSLIIYLYLFIHLKPCSSMQAYENETYSAMGKRAATDSPSAKQWTFSASEKADFDRGIGEMDDSRAEGGEQTTSLTLTALYYQVEKSIEDTLDSMKESIKFDDEIDLFLHLNDILLAFQHWNRDIIVQNASPLNIIEEDTTEREFGMLAGALRRSFEEMLEILAEYT